MYLVWKFFALGFSALIPLVNPLGSAFVFLGLVGLAPIEVYRALARKIAVNTVIFLVVIALIGSSLLSFFGISLPIMQVSGGIVIAMIGWGLLNQKDSTPSAEKTSAALPAVTEPEIASLKSKAFYPFTFPITAGPAASSSCSRSASTPSSPSSPRPSLPTLACSSPVIVLSASVYLCYAYAPKIVRAISPATAHGIVRVIAFILFAIGIQITWNGLTNLLPPLLRR